MERKNKTQQHKCYETTEDRNNLTFPGQTRTKIMIQVKWICNMNGREREKHIKQLKINYQATIHKSFQFKITIQQ